MATEEPSCSKRLRLDENDAATLGNSIEEADSPLVFRLTPDGVRMATRISNEFHLFPYKEEAAHVMGLDDSGNLVCGRNALKCEKQWKLMDFLDSRREKEFFKMTEDDETVHEVNLEFFLGMILTTLKDQAEASVRKKLDSAVFTVPSWLSSHFRVQIKDAAKIVGFTEVRLINQELLAAYAYADDNDELPDSSNILVLAENFGVPSGILYSYSKGNGRLTMNMMRDGYGTGGAKRMDSKSRTGKVANICSFIPSFTASVEGVETSVVFLTESPEWMDTFKEVADGIGCDPACGLIPVPCDLFGGSLLGMKKVEEIYGAVKQYLPERLCPCRDGNARKRVNVVQPDTPIPKQKIKHKLAMKLFQKAGKPIRFFQENLLCGGGNGVTLLELECDHISTDEFTSSLNGSLNLTFEINQEGIVTLLEVVVVVVVKKSGNQNEDASQTADQDRIAFEGLKLKTMNLKDEEKDGLKNLICSIFGSQGQTESQIMN